MPPRPLNELMPDEKEILIYAAKILTALRAYEAAPPQTAELREYWTSSLGQDLVCTILSSAHSSMQTHAHLESYQPVV